jgi:hypothetical protein
LKYYLPFTEVPCNTDPLTGLTQPPRGSVQGTSHAITLTLTAGRHTATHTGIPGITAAVRQRETGEDFCMFRYRYARQKSSSLTYHHGCKRGNRGKRTSRTSPPKREMHRHILLFQ